MDVIFWIIAAGVVGFIGYKAYHHFNKSDSDTVTGTGTVIGDDTVEPDETKPQK